MTTDIALLVSGDGTQDFGGYTEALLRMEGLRVGQIPLEVFDVGALPSRIVVASDLPLTLPEAEALRGRAEAGARLVFLAPNPFFATAFGFTPTYRSDVDGYLRLRVPSFTDEPLQFHAALRHLTPPAGAEVLAEVCDSTPAYAPTGAPAIVRVLIGRGEAVFFLYDLPRSIAQTRQGDPRRAGLHGNHVDLGWRAADMFSDFLAPDCSRLPQADIQCHLLRHLLAAPLAGEPVGVPSLWTFPNDAPTAILLTSDDDWSTPAQFDALHECLRRRGATITYYLVPDTIVTPERKAQWEAEGDTFSIHAVHHEPLVRTWRDTIRKHRASYHERFAEEPGPSIRNHAIPWVGYVRGAHWNLETGFRWDANFFACPPTTMHYMTGSGLPLPFVDVTGEMIPVWQQPCQYSDETTLAAGGFAFSLNLSTEEGIATVTGLMRANAEEHHSMLCINTHPVSFALYSGAMWDAVLAEAERLGVPRMSLEAFARFWEQREKVEIGAAEPGPDGWSWQLRTPEGSGSVSVLLPSPASARLAWSDGAPVVASRRVINGVDYALVRLPSTAGERRLIAHV
jgi:hypothetical protein